MTEVQLAETAPKMAVIENSRGTKTSCRTAEDSLSSVSVMLTTGAGKEEREGREGRKGGKGVPFGITRKVRNIER